MTVMCKLGFLYKMRHFSHFKAKPFNVSDQLSLS